MPRSTVDAFVANVVGCEDRSHLVRLFADMTAAFGINVITYHIVRRNFRSLPASEGERIQSAPDFAGKLFKKGQCLDFDPVVTSALASLRPFDLYAFERDGRIGAEFGRMLRALHDHEFRAVMAFPTTVRMGDLAVFSLSSRGHDLALSKAQISILELTCKAIHDRFEEIEGPPPRPRLSRREGEAMSLVAEGCANAEIAERLGVSRHTVDTLLRRSFAKLGAQNRTQAAFRFALEGDVRARCPANA
jgi:DNA-binding CsgD family transcriptional regulator